MVLKNRRFEKQACRRKWVVKCAVPTALVTDVTQNALPLDDVKCVIVGRISACVNVPPGGM